MKKQILGTAKRPRLIVTKSLKNLYAQVIDDLEGKTLVGLSSTSLKLGRGNVKVAQELGVAIADAAMKLGVTHVVFDRGERIYHGRIKAVADGARKKGLQF